MQLFPSLFYHSISGLIPVIFPQYSPLKNLALNMADSSSSPSQYIHLVQHLIEECILFSMSKEECMEALSKYADIKPVITATVWKELEKENREFFEAYKKKKEEKAASEAETRQRIHKMLSDSSSNGD